jgi:hypothetical protein
MSIAETHEDAPGLPSFRVHDGSREQIAPVHPGLNASAARCPGWDLLFDASIAYTMGKLNSCQVAVLGAQRHVDHSITTLRLSLSFALIARLGECPCCGRASAKLLL